MKGNFSDPTYRQAKRSTDAITLNLFLDNDKKIKKGK